MRMRSQRFCEALSSKFTLRGALCLLLLAVLTAGLSAQVSPEASDLPSSQQVLAFLSESIDWYRHRAIEGQLATDPLDLVFLNGNRPIAAQIVQLSFDFARADASLLATSKAKATSAAPGSGSLPDLAHFIQLENNADAASRQANQEVEALKKKLLNAHEAERSKLQVALDASQRRLDLLKTVLASLRDLVEFMQASGGRPGDLASSIDDLARTVPDVANPTAVKSQIQDSEIASVSKPRDSGILGLSAEVKDLGRKLSILDDEIVRTDKLRQLSNNLRRPLLAYANKRFPTGTESYLQASDLQALQQQKAELESLTAAAKALAPALVSLDKQNVLLSAYTSHLKEWRSAVVSENEKTWKGLIIRLTAVAIVIATLLTIGAFVRKVIDRHVHDPEHRHIIRVVERVVLWSMIVLVAAISFTSDVTSLVTFLGLLMAGVAVALQNVIVAAFGYFLLVGRHGIKLGDRVEISGVTGDVTDIGWLQFQLSEIDKATQQPTGRVVTFSNSFVFLSPATGLSKFKEM
jgi:Mechanosensitive ion channel